MPASFLGLIQEQNLLANIVFSPDPNPKHVFKTTLIPLYAVYEWPMFWPVSAYKSGCPGKGKYWIGEKLQKRKTHLIKADLISAN